MVVIKESVVNYDLKKTNCPILPTQITCSNDANKFVRKFYGDDLEVYETFHVIYLNQANQTIGHVKLGQGGICATAVDVRLIAKYAISTLSTGVILAHNHPSGTLKPSNADNKLTKQVQSALELFDIAVLDHLILSANSYYSFADQGTLN